MQIDPSQNFPKEFKEGHLRRFGKIRVFPKDGRRACVEWAYGPSRHKDENREIRR